MKASRHRPIRYAALLAAIALLLAACGTLELGVQPAATEFPTAESVGIEPSPTVASEDAGTPPAPLPTSRPTGPQPTPIPPPVTTVAVTPDGDVWFSFAKRTLPPSGGSGVKRLHGEEITQLSAADGLPHDKVHVLKVAPDGTLWAGGGCNVARFDGMNWERLDDVCTHIYAAVDLAFEPDGALWIAGPFKLLRYDGQSWTIYERMARSLAVAADGALWLSGWEGRIDSDYVGHFDGTTWTTHNTVELFDEAVAKIVVTPDGLLWGATTYHGVVRFDGEAWQEYTTADGLPSNRIVDIAVAPDGGVWALTDRGLARLGGDRWLEVDGSPPWATVMAFAPDSSIWFGTATGVVRFAADAGQATSTPAPPATPTSPQVLAFEATPARIDPGDTVTLTWQALGDKAMICPSSRFVLFSSDDCRQVPTSGATSFTVPQEAAGFGFIDFLLTVEDKESSTPAVGQVSVPLKCDRTWFFSDEPQAGVCPREPIESYAAAQHFERGTMIWIERLGRYVILITAPLYEDAQRKQVDLINDPLQSIRDTSADIHPPHGVYAPVSGFGLVWRGDVRNSPGYRESLGWALEPEFGYDAIFQCDDARPSGGQTWETCYLKGPQDEIIVLHPLGGWYLLDEPEQP
jgi:hypothetical protein